MITCSPTVCIENIQGCGAEARVILVREVKKVQVPNSPSAYSKSFFFNFSTHKLNIT